MKIYHIAQQQPELFPTEEYDYTPSVEEQLEDASSEAEVCNILERAGWEWEKIEFPNASPIILAVAKDNHKYVIDDIDFPELKDAQGWVDSIGDLYLDNYVKIPEEDFWEGVGDGYELYHGTSEDNVESILRDGLEARSDTRGISNRSMQNAVFTCPDLDYIQYYYGGNIIVIDAGAMKRDGYMPEVSGEEPLEEAEHRNSIAAYIGLDDYFYESYESEGYHPDTIAVYGDIPPKYLRKLED